MSAPNSGRTHVFVGPSLRRAEVSEIVPTAVIHPPVAHGDVLRLPLTSRDTVVIIDGVFQQAASIRHKEILEILSRGTRVIGAASMGALRAAELSEFGMTGHGVVHRLYAWGWLESDDEVALIHDDPRDNGDDWTARTVAKVSVRVLARRCRIRGTITKAEEEIIVAAAAELHFTVRGWTALLTRARENGLPAVAAKRIRALVRAPVTEWDVKAQDAVRALRAAEEIRRSGAGNGSDHARPSEFPTWSATGFLARWRNPPDGPVSMLVTAAQLYAEDYPTLHYRTILAAIAADGNTEPGDVPLPELEKAAFGQAHARGLIPGDGSPRNFRPWLGTDEAAEEAADERDDEQDDPIRRWCTALVRSYRWKPNNAPLPILYDVLQRTAGADQLREIIAATAEFNDILDARGYPTDSVSRRSIETVCQRYWKTTALAPTSYDRGFVDSGDLHRRVRPLAAYGLLRKPNPVRLLA